MQKYEYKIVDEFSVSHTWRLEKFDALGQKGWIYCGLDEYGDYIFRRPIDPNPEGEK